MNEFCKCRSCRLRRLWVVAVWALIVAGLVKLVLGCNPAAPDPVETCFTDRPGHADSAVVCLEQ